MNKHYSLIINNKGRKSEIEVIPEVNGVQFDITGDGGYFYGSVFKKEDKFQAYFGNDGGMTKSWFGTPKEKFTDCVIELLVNSNEYSPTSTVEEAWEIEMIKSVKPWNILEQKTI